MLKQADFLALLEYGDCDTRRYLFFITRAFPVTIQYRKYTGNIPEIAKHEAKDLNKDSGQQILIGQRARNTVAFRKRIWKLEAGLYQLNSPSKQK
jgi:hypothetical protein